MDLDFLSHEKEWKKKNNGEYKQLVNIIQPILRN